ncbi:MAG: hypothetical protein GKS06_01555 [Acidobacteria bacterium]|nr:hypothetical protein [Acidobacteriota bacterium]
MRSRRLYFFAIILLVTAVSCVSRNVERIDDEEAAQMEAPPEPLSAEERANRVVADPGFTGSVRLGDEIASAPDGVLYVIVRVAGRAGGPPLAVKRLPVELPTDFVVTSADSMIPGTPLVDGMDVTIRVDQDGDAFTVQPGDLQGSVGPVAIGDTIEIVLGPAPIDGP